MLAQVKICRSSRGSRSNAAGIIVSVLALLPFSVIALWGQTAQDPGVRGGNNGTGKFISGLTVNQAAVEGTTKGVFTEVNVVSLTGFTVCPTGSKCGLGPRFDSNSCNSCHAQPAIGGSSLASNPLFAIFQLDGATNTMPAFETPTGPTVVARFPFQSDGVTPNGLVQQLFTVTGRSDAAGCSLAQPDFAGAAGQNNLINRQSLPVFGDGLIEIIQDSDIIANMNANLSQKLLLGISGHPNRAPDGSISRLGWKAQTRSLLIFGGQAYNIEEGVTDEEFPNEIDETPGCNPNGVPEDHTDYDLTLPPHRFVGDPEAQAIFMRFLAPPKPGSCPGGPSTCVDGQTQFNNVGCVLCHTTSFTTPPSSVAALGNIQASLFSDLLVHDMGPCLADNIKQGSATGDQFRTAPLWGASQRVFFMHDGRTSNIVTAVEDHFCLGNSQYPNSEANAVINNFNALAPTPQQDLINFLRSL